MTQLTTRGFMPAIFADDNSMVTVEEKTRNPFILGNTKEIGFKELGEMLTPVFSRDNVETMSHTTAISTIYDAVRTYFKGQEINAPIIRVSHEMKVRTQSGAGKMVEHLKPGDSDSYYQRMMMMIEIPSIFQHINGCRCNLQVVLVRNYADCNLFGNSTQKQSFSCGIGLLNTVCTNGLLRTSDGCNFNIRVSNPIELFKQCMELFSQYNYKSHIEELRRLNEVMIDVPTLAQFLGRARMYQALPNSVKTTLNLPDFQLPEAQVNQMVRDYYTDESFGGFGQTISAWQFYMLLTNYKNNYIDVSLERSCNAYDCSVGIAKAITHEDDSWNWFIS